MTPGIDGELELRPLDTQSTEVAITAQYRCREALRELADSMFLRRMAESVVMAFLDSLVEHLEIAERLLVLKPGGHPALLAARGESVLDRFRKGKHLLGDERLSRLSAQEERILGEVAAGKTNRQIGANLNLAEKTVKNYVSSILSKLEVARRAEAAAYLARHTQPFG